MYACVFSDPIVKDQGRGATATGMAASSTPVSSSSMMAGKKNKTKKKHSGFLEVLIKMFCGNNLYWPFQDVCFVHLQQQNKQNSIFI